MKAGILLAAIQCAAAYQVSISAQRLTSQGHRAAPLAMAIDPETLNAVAVYDSAKEVELKDLRARVISADLSAAQQRELVGKAQEDLWKQNDMMKALKDDVAAAKAEAAAAEDEVAAAKAEAAAARADAAAARAEAAAAQDEVAAAKAEVAAAQAEVQSTKELLETATTGAKALVGELEDTTRKKEMHYDKARKFYAEAMQAKEGLASLQAELEQLRDAASKDESSNNDESRKVKDVE